MTLLIGLLALFGLLGCNQQEPLEVDSSLDLGDPVLLPKNNGKPPERPHCSLRELGLNEDLGQPETIRAAIDLINSLPKPTSLPCFLDSLAKPVKVYLTASSLSVQPAFGPKNPRIFIMNSSLIMSISTSGSASETLEFAEFYSSKSSYKGELKFPVESELTYSAPFLKIERGEDGTGCRGCHFQETKGMIDGEVAYRSMALRPEPSHEISITWFARELMTCDLIDDFSHRCNIIRALFDEVIPSQATFPVGTPTFYESFNLR